LRVRIIDVVDDAGWDAPSNAERGYVPRYKRPCADNGALPNGYSWQDRGSNSNPTVITNRHWHGVHDAIAARLDLLIVAFGDDGDIWGDEHTVSDSNGPAIMDAKTVGPVNLSPKEMLHPYKKLNGGSMTASSPILPMIV